LDNKKSEERQRQIVWADPNQTPIISKDGKKGGGRTGLVMPPREKF